MRFVFVALALVSLLISSCADVPALRSGAHGDRLEAIQNRCQGNGSGPGTSKYARCVVENDRAENTRIQEERDAATAAGIEAAGVYSTESSEPSTRPTDMDCNFRKDGKYICISQ